VTEEWADEYGGVYRRPGPFGTNELIIVDPKAVGHVFSNSEVCVLFFDHTIGVRLTDSLDRKYIMSIQ
jgi:hypothetical protein